MRSLLLLLPLALAAQNYDIVMSGGRVMDPESGLDAVRYTGINSKKITAISTSPLHGKIEIDANVGERSLHFHLNRNIGGVRSLRSVGRLARPRPKTPMGTRKRTTPNAPLRLARARAAGCANAPETTFTTLGPFLSTECS
jgi:hypothetical protein